MDFRSRQSSQHNGKASTKYHTALTISDDQTNESAIEKRRLSALARINIQSDEIQNVDFSSLPQFNLITDLDFETSAHAVGPITTLQKRSSGNGPLSDKSPDLNITDHAENKDTDMIAGQPLSLTGNKGFEMTRNAQWMRTTRNIPALGLPEALVDKSTNHSSLLPPIKSAGSNSGAKEAGSGSESDNLSSYSEIKRLQKQVSILEKKLKQMQSLPVQPQPSKYQVLYRLHDHSLRVNDHDAESDRPPTIFMDPPMLMHNQRGGRSVHCSLPLENFELFLAVNSEISFIVFRDFHTVIGSTYEVADRESGHGDNFSLLVPFAESIFPVASDLKEALRSILGNKHEYRSMLQAYEEINELPAPYLFVYHDRHDPDSIKEKLSLSAQGQFDLLLGYVRHTLGEEYSIVDHLLQRKEILPQYVKYLFKAGDIIVERNDNEYTGYIAESWPPEPTRQFNHKAKDFDDVFNKNEDISKQLPVTAFQWAFTGLHWDFDGTFFRKSKSLKFEMSLERISVTKTDAQNIRGATMTRVVGIPITELEVFPLEYAPERVKEVLRKRGDTFWRCRVRRLVSYRASEQEQANNGFEERYMIDMNTYHSLHSEENQFSTAPDERLNEDMMKEDQPPSEKFQFLLPSRIKGYNLRRKVWYDLVVDRISEVVWNREAFKSLVIKHKEKELIQALVTSQLEAEKSTDFIAGKGNGLILLLHGGPGTGKTLTAESVAEIAEKPLYRVTCGDVGTKAEAVEKYLESVLHLGHIWGCVVLMDEADVFLEQRGLEDLERNALVSVFLRVLEYYDGILILTSNRVGTFDEAFRSRIQLAIHYPNLGPLQRFSIWQTFINRLETLDEAIDIADLRDHIDILKDEKMNGRQIRNIITNARQYARWKKATLTYEHIKDVIQVAGGFDVYLDKLHGGYTQDELAQDEGLRLA